VQVQSESTDKGGNFRTGVIAASRAITRGGQPFATFGSSEWRGFGGASIAYAADIMA
jgi:hypothetical protein